MITSEIMTARDSTPLTALTRTGPGVPMVLLHGAMADAAAWRGVLDALDPKRPVLAPNRRGRRPSGACGAGYSVDTEVDDLLVWLDSLAEPVDLVAHGYGGLIAVEAVRQGAPVRSLVLYDPVARPFGQSALPAITEATRAGDLDAVVTMINIDLSGYSTEHVNRLRRGRGWATLRELARPAAAELAAIDGCQPDWGAYGGIDVPVALIAGEHSAHRAPYGGPLAAFQEALGVAELAILPGQDHLAHITAPVLLADTIEAQLARLAEDHR